ncbi:efflux RND transporter periplasmic adaptor subunit [Candidatus Woesebacteria bacterium]|nr:MAG: efflux RND transporter periplasmic adaptor subunit [Candidatus Woesebacteria bacterium]
MRKIITTIRTNKLTHFITKTRRRKLLVFAVVIFLVIGQLNKSMKPDFELEVTKAEKKTLEETISASGKVSAEKLAQLSFLATENINEIVVNDGSYVKKGDLIAKLNSSSIYQSYLQAEANLRAAEANADSVLDSIQNKEKTETFAEINARTAAEVARDNAYRSFVIAQQNLSNTTLRAPFDGILSYADSASIGKLASSLEANFIIVDPTTVYFTADVGEIDIPTVKVGTPVRLELDAYPDEKYDEKVISVGYVSKITSTGGTAYKINISLPNNTENKFRVGMNGDAELILSTHKDTISIPQSALIEENGNDYVWVVNQKGKAEKVEVKTGTSSINDIEIVDGLNIGDTVISRPPAKIEVGNKIKIKNEDNSNGKFMGLF